MNEPTHAAGTGRGRARVTLVVAGALALLAWGSPAPAGSPARPAVVLVGDTQRTGFAERLLLREQDDAEREAVMRGIAASDPKQLVILGDVVAKGGDAGAWEYFDRIAAPVRALGIPMAAVPGNHEYFGDRGTMRAAMSARFALLGTRSWGVVRSGGIALVLLDSNFDRLAEEAVREQQRWYEAELARLERDETVRFIVVACHHPPFTNSRIVSPSPEVERRFVPPFVAAAKAVLFASGHCHSYEHFRSEGKDFVVTGGGGGPRQRVELDPLRRPFSDLFAGPAIRPFHYCRLDVGGDRLVVSMVRLDDVNGMWSVGDRFVAGGERRP